MAITIISQIIFSNELANLHRIIFSIAIVSINRATIKVIQKIRPTE